jgi:hypothetical protein
MSTDEEEAGEVEGVEGLLRLLNKSDDFSIVPPPQSWKAPQVIIDVSSPSPPRPAASLSPPRPQATFIGARFVEVKSHFRKVFERKPMQGKDVYSISTYLHYRLTYFLISIF